MNALSAFAGQELWHIAGWTMLHYLWLGALVGLFAILCRLLLRRASANLRYATALTCLAVLAALPAAIATWLTSYSPPLQGGARGRIPDPVATIELNSPEFNSPPATNQHQIIDLRDQPKPLAAAADQPEIGIAPAITPNSESSPNPSLIGSDISFAAIEPFVPYLPWLWIIGTPLTFALLAAGIVGSKRLQRSSRAIDDPRITDMLARLQHSLCIGRRVSIAICDRIASPVLIGIVRPIILLPPAALTGWSPDEIEMVLLHELAHVRRWDNLVNLMQRFIESLLFFHPAVWLISNWARRERESCCDAFVVRRTERPHAYAELLLNLAAVHPPLAGLAFAHHPLRTRIRRILQLEDDPMLISGKSLALTLAGLLVAATLTVLYLPTIGQAEESATEVTENTEKSDKEQPDDAGSSTPEPILVPQNFVLKRGEAGEPRLYLNGIPIGPDVVRTIIPNSAKLAGKVRVSVSAESGVDPEEMTKLVELLKTLGVKKLTVNPPSKGANVKTDQNVDDNWPAGVTKPGSSAGHAISHPKFPSLEDQKLADLVWKRLRLEMESIDEKELERVKALGYDGGLKVSAGVAGLPHSGVGRGENITTGDILVGLHVWPTITMKDLVAVLNRDDLAELGPLKFYVIRQGDGFGASGERVVTGRVSVNQPSQGSSSYTPGNPTSQPAPQPPALPGVVLKSQPTGPAATGSQTDHPHYVLPSPENEAAAAPKPRTKRRVAAPGATPTVPEARQQGESPAKSALRYDGKSFDEWRDLWQNELSAAKRAEAVRALAAFGKAGYGKEATGVILDVAGNYDFFQDAYGTPQKTVLEELTPESRSQDLAKFWLPDLVERLKKEPKKWQPLTSNLLYRLRTDDPDVIAILQSLAQNGSNDIRADALSALVRLAKSPDGVLTLDDKTRQLLADALNSKDPAIVSFALRLLLQYPAQGMGGGGFGGRKVASPNLMYQPELLPLLFHDDEPIRQQARDVLQHINEKNAPQVVEQLVAVLKDDSRKKDHLHAIRALAAMGKRSQQATPELAKILKHSDDKELLFATLVAVTRIDGGLTTIQKPNGEASFDGDSLSKAVDKLLSQAEHETFGKKIGDDKDVVERLLREDKAILSPTNQQQLGGGGGFF